MCRLPIMLAIPLVLPVAAAAAEWPAKPIRVIVPFAAGGAADSAGFGTVGNWVAEYLSIAERIKLTHVAYKGGAIALHDLLAGHVKIGMLSYASVAGHIRAGTLVPLAVTSANRPPYMPDLPTLR